MAKSLGFANSYLLDGALLRGQGSGGQAWGGGLGTVLFGACVREVPCGWEGL